jgi:hypothetical protein
MAQSQLALYNMALAACGQDYTLSAVNEESVAAELCELWYENTRQMILRAAHWNSARRFSRLTEEAERDESEDWVAADPNPGWYFSYDLPTSMLAARYLTDFSQFDIGYDDNGKVLNCNVGGTEAVDAPVLCYTVDVTDVTLWEPDLYQAVIYGLAGNITMPLTGKVNRARANFELANAILLQARAANANERYQNMQQWPETLQIRGHIGPVATNAYVAPYGSLFSSTGAPVV